MEKLYRILGKRGRITIPCELRMRMGFACSDILSFTPQEDGKSILIKREKICDGCKGALPVREDRASLLAFLSGLSSAEQQAALIHLSVLWAEQQKEEVV